MTQHWSVMLHQLNQLTRTLRVWLSTDQSYATSTNSIDQNTESMTQHWSELCYIKYINWPEHWEYDSALIRVMLHRLTRTPREWGDTDLGQYCPPWHFGSGAQEEWESSNSPGRHADSYGEHLALCYKETIRQHFK